MYYGRISSSCRASVLRMMRFLLSCNLKKKCSHFKSSDNVLFKWNLNVWKILIHSSINIFQECMICNCICMVICDTNCYISYHTSTMLTMLLWYYGESSRRCNMVLLVIKFSLFFQLCCFNIFWNERFGIWRKSEKK